MNLLILFMVKGVQMFLHILQTLSMYEYQEGNCRSYFVTKKTCAN